MGGRDGDTSRATGTRDAMRMRDAMGMWDAMGMRGAMRLEDATGIRDAAGVLDAMEMRAATEMRDAPSAPGRHAAMPPGCTPDTPTPAPAPTTRASPLAHRLPSRRHLALLLAPASCRLGVPHHLAGKLHRPLHQHRFVEGPLAKRRALCGGGCQSRRDGTRPRHPKNDIPLSPRTEDH